MTDLHASLESLRSAYEAKRVVAPAAEVVHVYEYQLAGSPSWLIYFTAGVDMREAEKSLRDKFGIRLIAVKERT
jgi:hypothetical protein